MPARPCSLSPSSVILSEAKDLLPVRRWTDVASVISRLDPSTALGCRLAPLRMTLAVVWLVAAAPALAQHEGHQHGVSNGNNGAQADTLAAPSGLSAEEVTGLLEGQGMGMAKPAEMNGYPGPLHVLQLADSLDLTPEQRATAEALRAALLAEARALGAQIVAAERALDAAFAQGCADAARVDALTGEIGQLRGRLRAAHLRAHLGLRDALTPAQRARYAALRAGTR